MSRYCGDVNAEPILDAANYWRDAALLAKGSIFSNKALWNSDALEQLDRYFVQRPDLSDSTFLEKLEEQLRPASPAAKQLAAEMMWLLYLCPSSLTSTRKRAIVETIWSWSGEALPVESPWLAERILTGIGSAGPGFNQNQWRELVFLINFSRSFIALDEQRKHELLNDGWVFDEWLKNIPDWEARQFRHMLLYLLFPDDFERIFGQNDRKTIASFYAKKERKEINSLDPVKLDRELRAIRTRLETEHQTSELDYYVAPLQDEWRAKAYSGATEDLKSNHVLQALEEIDKTGIPDSAKSTGYDLVNDGKRYPPKLVLSLAVKYATGESLDRSLFKGGEDSHGFSLLRKLGFEISVKEEVSIGKEKLAVLVQQFLDQARAATDLSVRAYRGRYEGLDLSVSFGKGNFARIPWIAFLGAGQSVSNGIYPVLLFFKEYNELLLCYGVSEENSAVDSWPDLKDQKTVRDWFREKYDRKPERYGTSIVRMSVQSATSGSEIVRELDEVIDTYKKHLGKTSVATGLSDIDGADVESVLPVREDLLATTKEFSSALRSAGVYFGAGHELLVAAFVSSVATKPLLILTGLSGSGKTQIAIQFGKWLGSNRLLVSAVRPDWTGPEALFGYEDGLKQASNGKAVWSVPAPLAFMLTAAADPQHPYLLVLDEMNLAHVERYFADVLSGMESGQPCLPNLKRDQGVWQLRDGESELIALPRNVWIVGTVNVDETTYMFSPKVLDRANTFEFRVGTGDLFDAASKPKSCAPGSSELIRGLLKIASNDERQVTDPATFHDSLIFLLRKLHEILSRFDLEFGHRVFYESTRFASLAEGCGISGLDMTLDRIVLQKILPKLHGSRRRLEIPLLALLQFCEDPSQIVQSDEKLLVTTSVNVDEIKLPSSHAKLVRMLRSLRANQFVSFTE